MRAMDDIETNHTHDTDAMGLYRVDETSAVPLWIQIRRRLVYLIASGKYAEGERIPSVRELSVCLEVNYNTINKVYQDLERDGFIFTKRGKGSYVSPQSSYSLSSVDDEVEVLASELVAMALGKGMSSEDILELVQEKASGFIEEKNAP